MFTCRLVTHLLFCSMSAGIGAEICQPAQPATGPGGSDYRYEAMISSEFGAGIERCHLFEPKGVAAQEALPVVLFLHGFMGTNPEPYCAWITHLVRRGSIVVYPCYQEGLRTRVAQMTPAAKSAVIDALARLDGIAHARADFSRLAIVGHSLGGMIAANLAAESGAGGMPEAKALMVINPGDSNAIIKRIPTIVEDYRDIPARILLMDLVAENDAVVGSASAEKLWRAVTQIPEANKAFFVVRSDAHGSPSLRADHMAPLGNGRFATDALDYLVYWRLFDSLCEAAFTGVSREAAIDGYAKHRPADTWSDGRPLELIEAFEQP